MIEEPEDYKVTKEHMDGLFEDGRKVFKEMKREYFIRNFPESDGNVMIRKQAQFLILCWKQMKKIPVR